MSKKIQAARSTVPKARGKKSSSSDQAGAVYRVGLALQIAAVCMYASARPVFTDATGDTATPTLHRPLEGPSKVSVQPRVSGIVPG